MRTRDRHWRTVPTMAAAAVAILLGAGLASGCSGDDGPDGAAQGTISSDASATSSEASETSTTEAAPTSDGPGATLGPNCTVGTIPPGDRVPSGCDRLYAPFVFPGQDCTEGQAPDCIDPDGDGRYTMIGDGGRCLVQRNDPDLCRDDDGDGVLDAPLTG